jgi:hypothetical protein
MELSECKLIDLPKINDPAGTSRSSKADDTYPSTSSACFIFTMCLAVLIGRDTRSRNAINF